MKYIAAMTLLLVLLVAAGCGGDEAEATPFIIEDEAPETQPTETAVPPTDPPPPATDTPPDPTDTPTATPTNTPTATLVISTVPADETPLQPGIQATPNLDDPDIAATVIPILTAFPDMGLGDIDLDALPQLPDGFEIPELPPLPGG